MRISNTSERLKRLLRERNLRQSDVVALAAPIARKYNDTLTKCNLSFYVTGRGVPAQNKLAILAEALDVSEAWLMGYDVPMSREISSDTTPPEIRADVLLDEIQKLDERQRDLLKNYIELLLNATHK